MTVPLSDWHPEEWLNGWWLIVRYRPQSAGVLREVYPPQCREPELFTTKREALNMCRRLSRGVMPANASSGQVLDQAREIEALKAEVARLKGRATGASDPAKTARVLIRTHTDDAEEFASLEHAIVDSISAEHTRWVMANAGWKETARQLAAAESDVKALAEALKWALDMLAINDQLILEKLPEAWKSLNQDIDVAAKRRAHAALARDGVRRVKEENV